MKSSTKLIRRYTLKEFQERGGQGLSTDMQPGRYVHFKGAKYLLLIVAQTHNHNGDLDVVYISLDHGKAVTRPLCFDSREEDAWLDRVEWPDGKIRQRFVHESDLRSDG